MTTTAHEDQFTTGTQTIEPVRHPYSTEAILRRNVADLELALRTQTERAEAAEAELAKLVQQKHAATLILSRDGSDFEMFYDIKDLKFDGDKMRLYAAPVPTPAVPELDPMNRLIVSDPKQPKSPQQATSVPKEWRDYVFAAADELRLTVRDLKNGFVRCGNCGEQETTSDLDCVSDIDGALELLDELLQSAPATVAVTAEWREVISDLLANDGADGGRYDANKWLAARDKARALLQSAEVTNADADRLIQEMLK